MTLILVLVTFYHLSYSLFPSYRWSLFHDEDQNTGLSVKDQLNTTYFIHFISTKTSRKNWFYFQCSQQHCFQLQSTFIQLHYISLCMSSFHHTCEDFERKKKCIFSSLSPRGAPKCFFFFNELIGWQLKSFFLFRLSYSMKEVMISYSNKNVEQILNRKIYEISDYNLLIFTEKRGNLKIKFAKHRIIKGNSETMK